MVPLDDVVVNTTCCARARTNAAATTPPLANGDLAAAADVACAETRDWHVSMRSTSTRRTLAELANGADSMTTAIAALQRRAARATRLNAATAALAADWQSQLGIEEAATAENIDDGCDRFSRRARAIVSQKCTRIF